MFQPDLGNHLPRRIGTKPVGDPLELPTGTGREILDNACL